MAAVGAAISYPSVPFTKLASKVKWNMFRLGFGLLCSQNMKKKKRFLKIQRAASQTDLPRFSPIPIRSPSAIVRRESRKFLFLLFFITFCASLALWTREKRRLKVFFPKWLLLGASASITEWNLKLAVDVRPPMTFRRSNVERDSLKSASLFVLLIKAPCITFSHSFVWSETINQWTALVDLSCRWNKHAPTFPPSIPIIALASKDFSSRTYPKSVKNASNVIKTSFLIVIDSVKGSSRSFPIDAAHRCHYWIIIGLWDVCDSIVDADRSFGSVVGAIYWVIKVSS